MRVSFCAGAEPAGPTCAATPAYDAEPERCFAALHVGEMGLSVGGGGDNGQFAKMLQASARQAPWHYQGMHVRIFAAAKTGILSQASPDVLHGNPNCERAYVRLLAPSKRWTTLPRAGAVFLSVFRPDKRPFDHARNIAMLYTTGPHYRECKSEAHFLEALRAVAANVACCLAEYNARAGEGQRLEVFRLRLVSSGAFAGDVAKVDMALAMLKGLCDGNDPKESPVYELAHDDNCFFEAWQMFASRQ